MGTLCPPCWAEAEFIAGPSCPGCGAPVAAGTEADSGDHPCDSCLAQPRPWDGARAALVYRGTGRKLVLALKHGDRADLAAPLGDWLARAAAPLIVPDMVVIPVPLHPRRLLQRRYNQAMLLAARLARRHRLPMQPVALRRLRPTPMQDHRRLEDRFANQQGAIVAAPRAVAAFLGRPVLLVDDVMASGATLSESAQALLDAGAGAVFVAALARAVRDA